VVCQPRQFGRKYRKGFSNAQKISSTATAGLSTRAPGRVGQSVDVEVRRKIERFGMAQCPSVRAFSVSASKINVDSATPALKFRSDLGARADLNTAGSNDFHKGAFPTTVDSGSHCQYKSVLRAYTGLGTAEKSGPQQTAEEQLPGPPAAKEQAKR
jgi:hypothetical protein